MTPDESRLVSVIDFGDPDYPILGYDDLFAAVYEGKIYIENDGEQRFLLTSDDGGLLYINDQLVIDNDGVHVVQTIEGIIDLSEGYHDIRIEYSEKLYQQYTASRMVSKRF